MYKNSLDIYDELPEDMIEYLKYNGRHFNKHLCDFAVSQMEDSNGKITPYTEEQVDSILRAYNITLDNDILYDKVFVANMCKADYLGKSVPNENYLAQYIKDVLDDVDGYDGIAFNRWYADTCRKGVPINWYKFK